MTTILNHNVIAAAEAVPVKWLYIVHGIYGSGRNWGSVARRFVEGSADWGVVLVDLRLHGGSTTGFSPPHTVRACADDLARLQASLGHPATAILGHSYGGKVALLYAAEAGKDLHDVWVVDSTLRTGEPSGSPWEVLGIVRELPDRFTSRDEVADAFEHRGYSRAVGQWLAMNLERDGDAFRWKLDWDGVEEMLRDYFVTDVWPVVENPPGELRVHLVKASRSDAIDPEAVERIRRAGERTERVYLHTVEGGHWLNVDNPDAVLELLTDELTVDS